MCVGSAGLGCLGWRGRALRVWGVNRWVTCVVRGVEGRPAVGLVALIALLRVALGARSLPLDPDEPHQDPIRELRDFNRKPVWRALGIGAIGFAGMFCV